MQYKKRVSRFSPNQFLFFLSGILTLFLLVETLVVNVWQVAIFEVFIAQN